MSSPSLIGNSKRKYRVAVVGAGALGSEFCRLIANACQLEIVLIDPDKMEPRNLNYSEMLRLACDSLFGTSIHHEELRKQFKGNLIVATAESLFHQKDWQFIPVEIADVNLSTIAACDLIISCTDSALARCEATWIARLLGKGVVDGGLKDRRHREGRVAWYPPHAASACYLCEIAESRRADVLSYAVSGSLGCMARPMDAAMDAAPEMVTVVAEQIVRIVRRALTSDGAVEGRWRHRNNATAWLYGMRQGDAEGQDLSIEEVALVRSVTCPWHESLPADRLTTADTTIAVREVLRDLSQCGPSSSRMVLELQWPICLHARCTACGAESRPLRRLGWIRRHGICMKCRTVGAMESLETLQTFTEDSPAAGLTLGDFGFSADDLFCFRPEYL